VFIEQKPSVPEDTLLRCISGTVMWRPRVCLQMVRVTASTQRTARAPIVRRVRIVHPQTTQRSIHIFTLCWQSSPHPAATRSLTSATRWSVVRRRGTQVCSTSSVECRRMESCSVDCGDWTSRQDAGIWLTAKPLHDPRRGIVKRV